jgi:hypothetical protein
LNIFSEKAIKNSHYVWIYSMGGYVCQQSLYKINSRSKLPQYYSNFEKLVFRARSENIGCTVDECVGHWRNGMMASGSQNLRLGENTGSGGMRSNIYEKYQSI